MWDYILHLSAQQTTAPELATFLVIVTLACLLVAQFIYIAIMTVAWGLRLRRKCRWHQVVLPTLPRIRANAWEYSLAALTSVVLTVTLAEKDGIVDAVLNLRAEEVLDDRLMAGLFPLHRLPDATDLGDQARVEDLRGLTTLSVADWVRQPLEDGRSSNVRMVLVSGVRKVLTDHPTWHTVVTRGLTLLAVFLILAYVAVLATKRIIELARSGPGVESPYRDVLGRLTVLGVCLALLLATPALAADPELLADSALAAARRSPRPATPEAHRLDSLIELGTARQYELQAVGVGADTMLRRFIGDVSDKIATLSDWAPRVDALQARLAALGDSVRRSVGDLAHLQASLGAIRDPSQRLSVHEADLKSLSVRIDSLGRTVEAVRVRGLLLVETTPGQPYTIVQPAAAPRAAVRTIRGPIGGTSIGIHWLAPGQYTVGGPGMESQTVTLGTGQALTVHLSPIIIR